MIAPIVITLSFAPAWFLTFVTLCRFGEREFQRACMEMVEADPVAWFREV